MWQTFLVQASKLPYDTIILSFAYPVALLLTVLFCLLFRRYLAAIIFSLAAILFAYLPHLTPIPAKPDGALRIVSMNALIHDSDTALQSKNLPAGADVIGIIEANEKWQTEALSLKQTYPHQTFTPQLKKVGYGVYKDNLMVLSKWPVTEMQDFAQQAILYHIAAPQPFHLLLVHGLAPRSVKTAATRNRFLTNMAIQQLPQPLVVMGDFNTVPWDGPLHRFTKAQNLHYATRWLPTYSAAQPMIPIDHILHSPELKPVQTARWLIPTADHLGQLADFQLP